MLYQEAYVNRTEGYIYGETNWEEIEESDIPGLFARLQKEYGRCVSKVYVHHKESCTDAKAVGWVFEKRQQYSDSKDTYLMETWVSLAQRIEPAKIVW